MVGIESPVKEGYDTPYSYMDGGYESKQVEMEIELENVRQQLEDERKVNDDLRHGRDQWLADMEATLQQSRNTLSLVQNRNIDLKTEVEREEAPGRVTKYRPLTSPGMGTIEHAVEPQPMPQPSPMPYPYPAPSQEQSPMRTHKSMMSPAMPMGVEHTQPTNPVPSSIALSNTSNVAKQAWNNFIRVASDTFSPSELTLVSLETLKGLLKHYNVKDPIECARIEVYWRLLALHRENESVRGASIRSHNEMNSPTKKRSKSASKFVPVDHPRPFQVEAPKKGPHLSRRSPLRPGSPLSCNPNATTTTQYNWATHLGRGTVGEKPTKRTYNQSLDAKNRSCSQPVTYKTSSCPEATPSTFHSPIPKGLKTFRENPVAGNETTQKVVKSGRRAPEPATNSTPPSRSLKVVPKQEPKEKRYESVKYSAAWRTDHLGATTVNTKADLAEVRGRRRGYPAQVAHSDPVVSPRHSTIVGLRVAPKAAAVGNPNPPQSGYYESDRKGDKSCGVRVHDVDWKSSHHSATLPFGGGFVDPVRIETAIPPQHIDSVRRLHAVTDLHGGDYSKKTRVASPMRSKMGSPGKTGVLTAPKAQPAAEPSPPSLDATPPVEVLPTPASQPLREDSESRAQQPQATPIAINRDALPSQPKEKEEERQASEEQDQNEEDVPQVKAGLPSTRIEPPSVFAKVPRQRSRTPHKRGKVTVHSQVPRCAEIRSFSHRTPHKAK